MIHHYLSTRAKTTSNLKGDKNIATNQNPKKRKLEEKGNLSGGKRVRSNPENTSPTVSKQVKGHRKSATVHTKTSSKPTLGEKNVVNLTKKYEALMDNVKDSPIEKYVHCVLQNFDIIRTGRDQLINNLEALANHHEPSSLTNTKNQPIRHCIELLKKMQNMDPFATSIDDAIQLAHEVKTELLNILSFTPNLNNKFQEELRNLIGGLNNIAISLENLHSGNISNKIKSKQADLDDTRKSVKALAIWGAILTIGGILATAAVIVAAVLVNPFILFALYGCIALLGGGGTCIGLAIGNDNRKDLQKGLDELTKHQNALNLFLSGLKELAEKEDVPQKPESLNDENSLPRIKEPSEKEKQQIAAENFLKQFNEEMANLENK